MNGFEAFYTWYRQGLTEFLPVSSSGHLAIGSALFGVNPDDNLMFAVAVHAATVLSTIVVLWGEIAGLFKGLFRFTWNEETKMVFKIVVSMIPVAIVGGILQGLRGANIWQRLADRGMYVDSHRGIAGVCLLCTSSS